MASVHKNVLLVEGSEDRRVIPELMEANGIHWGSQIGEVRKIRSPVSLDRNISPYPPQKTSPFFLTKLRREWLRVVQESDVVVDYPQVYRPSRVSLQRKVSNV